MSEVKSNPMKDFGIPTIVLTLICAIAAAAMVCVYEITAPIIAANTKAAADAARAEVYVGVSGFEEIDVSAFENCSEAYKTSGGEGYVFTTAAKGFDGPITVMTAIDMNGTIVGVKVLSHTETPGLGSRTTEAAYLEQYVGKDSALDGIEFIAGVTYSGKGVNGAIANAFEVFESVKGQ